MRKMLLTAAAAAIAVGTLASAGAEARPGVRADGRGHVAGRGHYAGRRGGNRAAGAAVAGVAGALIGGAIAANASRNYGAYNDPYGNGYGYPSRAYGAPVPYYGY